MQFEVSLRHNYITFQNSACQRNKLSLLPTQCSMSQSALFTKLGIRLRMHVHVESHAQLMQSYSYECTVYWEIWRCKFFLYNKCILYKVNFHMFKFRTHTAHTHSAQIISMTHLSPVFCVLCVYTECNGARLPHWTAIVTEEFPCRREDGNRFDPFAVRVMRARWYHH